MYNHADEGVQFAATEVFSLLRRNCSVSNGAGVQRERYNQISHLNEIDDEANEMFELLVKQIKERQGITEALKAQDQIAWVKAMNNIRNSADEIVLNECNRSTTTPSPKTQALGKHRGLDYT